MSSSAKIITDMRAACRAHLLSIEGSFPSAAGNGSVSGDVLTMPGFDFAAAGFWPGAQVTIANLRSNPLLAYVLAVDGETLLLDEPVGDGAGVLLVRVRLPRIAWQDETFEPMPGQPHLTEVFRRVGGRPVLFGGQWRHNMLLTLSLFWPSGKGTIGPESMSGRLLELFRPGVGLAYGANRGKVTEADAPQSLPEPAWTLYPVTIAVTAWTDN